MDESRQGPKATADAAEKRERVVEAFNRMRDRVRELELRASEPIAVVGMGCRFPGNADSPGRFWQLLRDGVDATREVPADRWDVDAFYDPDQNAPGKMYTRRGGFLEQRPDGLDASFFGITGREAVLIDPQQRLLLEVAWEGLADAGMTRARLAQTSCGVFVGIMTIDYALLAHGSQKDHDAYFTTGNFLSIASNRLSYTFDLKGPSLTLDTACSSGLVALHLACQSLRSGESGVAIAAAANCLLAPDTFISLTKLGAIGPDGRCKTFAASGDGYGRGEGAAALVLKRLGDAVRDGDRIWGIVRGTAVNQDGRSGGLTVPNGRAQEEVVRAALQAAGVAGADYQYAEAHGTGTPLGDPVEIMALASVLGANRPADRPCAIGSVKTNIAHLEAAAGISGVVKTLLAIRNREIPASLHFDVPNPHIPFETLPFRVQTKLGPWPDPSRPLLAGVSSFGFGGTNAHAVLDEAPKTSDEPVANDAAGGPHLLVFSAKSEAALDAYVERHIAWLESAESNESVRDIAWTSSVRRDHFAHRVSVLGDSREAWAARLREGGAIRGSVGEEPPKIAFVYAGQGSQSWGMGRELLSLEPTFRDALTEVDALIQKLTGWSIVDRLAGPESEAKLDQTEVAQPAIFALQVGLTKLFESWGIAPAAVVGHSVGEIAAAWTAGALSLAQAAELAVVRGRIMQKATGLGKMAHVELPLADAKRAIAGVEDRVFVGALNGPTQTVLSGDGEALAALVTRLTGEGVHAKMLHVDYGFHTPRLRALADELARDLPRIAPTATRRRLFSTSTGAAVQGPELDASYWARQIHQPVAFHEAMRSVLENERTTVVEIGPHPVLAPAIHDIAAEKKRDVRVTASLRRGAPERESLLTAIATLHAEGHDVTWKNVLGAPSGRVVSLPTYPWQRDRFWAPTPRDAARDAGRRDPESATTSPGDTTDLLYRLRWQRAAAAASARTGGQVLVFASSGDGDVTAELVRRVGSDGSSVDVVSKGPRFEKLGPQRFQVDPSSRRDVAELLRQISASAADKNATTDIVYLWSLDEEATGPRGVVGALHLVQALAETATRARLWLATRNTQRVPGDDASIDAAGAGVWGFGATLAHEAPELRATLVDLDRGDGAASSAEMLAALVAEGGSETRVALRKGERWVARLERLSTSSDTDATAIRADGAYLVTGGLGALGLVTAEWLVARGARHLVLVGRSAPSTSARAALDRMRAAGAEIRVESVDVSDAAAVASLVRDTHARTPLRGVFHSAGALDDATVHTLSAAQLSGPVFAAKAGAAFALDAACRDIPLDFFVLYSSVAGVLGSPGQGNYAAANAILDALAHARRARGVVATSIAWGPWADVGMATREKATIDKLAVLGLRSLRPEQGRAILDRIAKSSDPTLAAVALDVAAFVATGAGLPLAESLAQTASQAAQTPELLVRKQLDQTPPARRAKVLDRYVVDVLAELAKVPPENLAADRPLAKYGFDSLMMVGLRNRIAKDLGLTLSVPMLYAHPTIRELSLFLLELHREASTTAEVASTPIGTTTVTVADPPSTSTSTSTADDVNRQLEQALLELEKRT